MKDTTVMPMSICDFCGRELEWIGRCKRCQILALHSLELAKQVAKLIPKGGVQLYIAIERTGEKNELLSVKRWSPFESLENVSSVEKSSLTSQSCQE